MKRDYESKKMFIFIVSLLFVLLAFTIIGLADESEITTPDNVDSSPITGLKEGLLKKVIPFYEVNPTDLVASTATIDADRVAAVTMDTAPSSGSSGSSGTPSTSDDGGSSTTNTDTSGNSSDGNNGVRDSEPDLVVATPKPIKRNFADAISISIPKKLNIDAPDRARPGVEIKVTVTSGGELVKGAIVKLVGESLTNEKGIALVKVPTNLENEKLILSASKEGYVSSLKYILITEITEEEMTSDNQLQSTNSKPQNEEISILPYFLEKTWKYQWMTTFNTKN